MHSKQEKIWENMISCEQLKNKFFLLVFYIKIAYFVRERIELFIGIYISMKSTFPFKLKKKYIITNFHMLLFWIIHMHHNYCLRRKQHSYVVCDAALAALFENKTTQFYILLKRAYHHNTTVVRSFFIWTYHIKYYI